MIKTASQIETSSPASSLTTNGPSEWIPLHEAAERLGMQRQQLWKVAQKQGIQSKRRPVNGQQVTAIRTSDLSLIQAQLSASGQPRRTSSAPMTELSGGRAASAEARKVRLSAELNKERLQREKAQAEAQAAVEARTQVAREADQLVHDLRQASDSLATTRAELASERKGKRSLEQDSDQRVSDFGKLEEVLSTERASRSEVEEELESVRSTEEAATNYATRLEADQRELKLNVARLRGELHEAHGDRRAQEREAESTKERLRGELKDSVQERDEHNTRRQVTQQERSLVEARLRQSDHNRQALARSLSHSQEKGRTASELAGRAEAQSDALTAKLRVLQGRLKAELSRSEQLEGFTRALRTELAQTQSQLATERAESERQEQLADQLSHENAAAIIALNEAESENERLLNELQVTIRSERATQRYADRIEMRLNSFDQLHELPPTALRLA